MITEKDLQEAIAECRGVKNPNAGTCIKLAAFLTIQREMFGKVEELTPYLSGGYSYDASPSQVIGYYGETEFAELIANKRPEDVWPVIDELMTTLQLVNPRLYAAVIRKIKD